MSKTSTLYPETLLQIERAQIPGVVHAAMRQRTRKEWAGEVRNLLKRLGIEHVSVTTPNYSMAQSIDISLPRFEPFEGAHEARHQEIDEEHRSDNYWLGYGNYCETCKRHWAAHKKIEAIIRAAFPDLDDRSDSQSDYFDFCLSIN